MARFADIFGRYGGWVVAFALVFQFATPHIHGSSSHDAEVCTGHLADHGGPDSDDDWSCPQCLTGHAPRFATPGSPIAATFAAVDFGVCTGIVAESPCNLLLSGRAAPRAPPALLS